MARITIGSARIDENGKAHCGKAGDQTGIEVSTQSWYKSSQGWRVFRAINKNSADRIAWNMAAACANANIGYDQYERDTLYNTSKPLGFDCEKVDTPCETDCSALVRVCCAYAGIFLKMFNTETEPKVLLDSGKFVELTGSMFTDTDVYLRRGDILVTSTKGHTVVVLEDGNKADDITEDFKRTLKKGDKGDDVAELQRKLIALGYDLGPDGADGDYGSKTTAAVKAFQKDQGLIQDGKFGPESYKVLDEATGGLKHKVQITGGNCWVRTAPNTNAEKLGSAKAGEEFDWGFVTADNGWQLIDYHNQNGWVSGRYGKLVD